jgi:hypothetical protein
MGTPENGGAFTVKNTTPPKPTHRLSLSLKFQRLSFSDSQLLPRWWSANGFPQSSEPRTGAFWCLFGILPSQLLSTFTAPLIR